MSKPRKSEVQLPGLKSKLKSKPEPKVVPPRGALSQEFVHSDNSSDEEPTPTRQNAPLQIGIHPPKANGIAKSTPKPAKTQKEISKAAAKAKAPAKKAAQKQVVREEQGAESPDSSEESEDEGTDIKSAQERQAASTQGGASESAGSSDSSSSDSEEEAAPKTTPKSAMRSARPTQPQSHTVEFQAARPYVPPKDFFPVSTNRASTFLSSAVFDNLEGKQVWHITAPADLSLKGLKQLAMEQVMQGKAVISQKGTDYGFSKTAKDEGGEREVVIPRQNGYKAVSARISQTFNVRQVINLPKLSSNQTDPNTGSEAAASITRSTIRAPRPQVKGLKMRYFPSGVGNHTPITLGFSDSEDERPAVQPAGLGVPNGLHLASKPEKRKHVEMNGNEAVENPSKKHRKHKTQEEIKRKEEKKAKKERKRQKELAKTKS